MFFFQKPSPKLHYTEFEANNREPGIDAQRQTYSKTQINSKTDGVSIIEVSV